MRQCSPPTAPYASRPQHAHRRSSRVRARPAQPCLETEFDSFTESADGVTVFSAQSQHGSGLVSVVSRGPYRSLTFQSAADAAETQQGLCLVDADGLTLPGSLVFTYLRTAAAAVAALAPSPPRPRYLALGLGSGSFPAFLQHHAPGALVQAVDIDPLVVSVARDQLGVRFCTLATTAELVSGARVSSAGFQVLVNDAAPCVAALAEAVVARSAQSVDAMLLDCYDGYGRVPPILDSPEFFSACCAAL